MARFCPSRAFILDLGGGWGFAVPFYFVQDCRWPRALAIYVKKFGVQHGDVATTNKSLSEIYSHLGHFGRAKKCDVEEL